jgi:D-tagatose-1,6-bisphosphate aldolase subunit GatZ/KbaZ
MHAIEVFRKILTHNNKGKPTGIYAVCSANEAVLKASIMQAKADNSILLVESTSNQVNQDGGYTGMKPRNFAENVFSIAQTLNFDTRLILLGGDHLGPNAWRHLPADQAIDKAKVLVHECVRAGYQKIHLDTSMFLGDDGGDRTRPLRDEIVARRAAELCSSAEYAWQMYHKNSPGPLYVIGAEVPEPGGARQTNRINVTRPDNAAGTIAVAREAFYNRNLQSAWERVCGLVVQPGVGFSDGHIYDYQRERAIKLSHEIEKHANFVYEAHSTDYQTPEALAQMVADHFCILKVGPWLTFACREALFILADLEKILYEDRPDRQSFLQEKIEAVMIDNPGHWERYYTGTESDKKLKRKFSYLDRIRYYWPDQNLQEARQKLYANLRETGIPLALISQYMPGQYIQIRQGRIKCDPEELVLSKIRDVLKYYSTACQMQNSARIVEAAVFQ